MFKNWIWVFIIGILAFSLPTVSAIDEATDSQGQIAIIGTDYNVYSFDFAESDLTQLTDDAEDNRHYQWTTWSNDGRLAYFCCEPNASQRPQAQVYISADGRQPGTLHYENNGEIIIYAYWSPADCGEDCREIALLTNDVVNGGLAIELLEDSEEPTSTTIAEGSPFYYHWDATGTNMIFHRGNVLDIYNIAQADISDPLGESSGSFQAPAWSPVDDRILIGMTAVDARQTNLTVIENGETHNLVEDIVGLLAFAWSPDGNKIAYRTIDRFGFSNLIVIDAQTGTEITSTATNGVISFFWSPDSAKIAYITFQSTSTNQNAKFQTVQDDSPTDFAWHILDIEAETDLRYSSFIPTFEMAYLLSYFDQFAPSHHLWSPDSRYLVFAGFYTDTQPEPMVYTLDTSNNNNVPDLVAEGVFGVWSFE